jgi:uncharacterized protein YqgQ
MSEYTISLKDLTEMDLIIIKHESLGTDNSFLKDGDQIKYLDQEENTLYTYKILEESQYLKHYVCKLILKVNLTE